MKGPPLTAAERGNSHYRSAAAELARAEETNNGLKSGVRIGAALVHALLFIGQKIDTTGQKIDMLTFEIKERDRQRVMRAGRDMEKM